MKNQNFGIEIEMTGITRSTAAKVIAGYFHTEATHVGGCYDAYSVRDNDGRMWKIMRDASVRCENRSGQNASSLYSVEFVTPICNYDDIETIQELVRKLRGAGARVNSSCGLHCHINAAPHTPKTLRNIVNIMAAKEDLLYKTLKVYIQINLSLSNGLATEKEPFIKACKLTRDVLPDTEEIDREMPELLRELEVVTELIKKCIAENSSSAQDQEKYTERYNNYVDRYEKAKSRYDEIEHQKENKLSKRKALDRFISDLSKRDELLTEFDNCLWLTVVDTVTVQSDGILLFKFNDGTEIKG